MKGVGAVPGKPDSLHIVDLPEPTLGQAPDGLGVLVRVFQIGLDGTDREIASGHYGAAPAGSAFLVLGHENLGVVEEVGSAVTGLAPGDYVVAMVRRPGSSLYDLMGMPDMSTDASVLEHGISGLHGFLTERYVDVAENLILVPAESKGVGVLLEPASVVEKGIVEAYEIQRRLRVWRPQRAAVLGAGAIGLMATLVLRLRRLDVTVLALPEPPNLAAELVEGLGARYASAKQTPLTEASKRFGPFDLIFEATGHSPLAFEAMETLGRNGVLVLSSVTSGDLHADVRADAINLGFVLGNKAMVGTVNASRDHYEAAVRDMALAQSQYPGWLRRLVTHRLSGLDSYADAFHLLAPGSGAIKVVIELQQAAGKGGVH